MRKTLVGAMLVIGLTVNAGVILVKDAQPVSEIVIATNANQIAKLAAKDLQEHIKLISGAKLEIVTSPTGKTPVYVGESPATLGLGINVSDIKGSGFKIIARDGYVALVGRDIQRRPYPYAPYGYFDEESVKKYQQLVGEKFLPDSIVYPGLGVVSKLGIRTTDDAGSWYAVAELLEQLGVRWYMPYEKGTVIPSLKTIKIRKQNLKKEAAFPVRDYFFYAIRDFKDINKWQIRQKVGSAEIYNWNHTMDNITGSPDIRKEHPEYFALRNGQRTGCIGQLVPKLSNSGFQQACLLYLRKQFEIYPEALGLAMGLSDCLCAIDDEDLKKWPYGETYTSRYTQYAADFNVLIANELKKTNPDKFLVYGAYGGTFEPPTNTMPDNLMVLMAYNTSTMAEPMRNALVEKAREGWLKILPSKKMFTWDYFLFYRQAQNRIPAFFFDLLQKDMQAWKGISVGKFFEVPAEKINGKNRLAAPGLMHMLIYWQNKLLWDPDLDRKKLFNEYYELYYGPARAEMKEFFEFAEEVYMRPESRSITRASGYLKEADVPCYFDILARARAKAGKDSVYDKRIAMIEEEIQPLKKLFESFKRTAPEVRMYPCDNPTQVDGDLTKPFWERSDWRQMRDFETCAIPDKNITRAAVRLSKDGAWLMVGVICFERSMDKLTSATKTRKNDDLSIFNDDCVEIFVETPERSYFQIAINVNGVVYDESQDTAIIARDTMPMMWNPGIRAAVKKYDDRWTVEVAIPTADFGKLGPQTPYPWGVNVGRTRYLSGEPEYFALSPGGKAFKDLTKLISFYIVK